MSPRVWLLSFTAMLTIGCNAPAGPAAHATPPPRPVAEGEPIVAQAVAEEPIVESPAAVEPAPVVTPASFATTQAATTAPIVVVPTTTSATVAEATPRTAVEWFDAQLAALIRDQPPIDPTADIDKDDRTLLRTVVDSLASFRSTLGNGTSLRQTKVAPLLELSEKIRSEIPLSLPTLALCREVTQFGVYDAFEPPRFTAGKATPVVVYCEVDHFRSQVAADDRWETRLTYEAVLYSDGESGVAVVSKKPTQIVDRCRNKRRDFFLADRMTIPANLPVGKYVLKVTVIDQIANLVAEKTVPVLVAPN